MDSLDEKQEAWEARMSTKSGDSDKDAIKEKDIKNLNQLLENERKVLGTPPEFITIKYNTLAGFMKAIGALAQKWQQAGGNEVIINNQHPVAKMKAQVYAQCMRELMAQLQLFSQQMRADAMQTQARHTNLKAKTSHVKIGGEKKKKKKKG